MIWEYCHICINIECEGLQDEELFSQRCQNGEKPPKYIYKKRFQTLGPYFFCMWTKVSTFDFHKVN